MKLLPGIVGLVFAVSGAAAQPKAVPTKKPVHVSLPEEVQCPAALHGVTLDLDIAERGVVIELARPNKDYVPQLRALVKDAAAMIEQHTNSNGSMERASTGKLDIPPVMISVVDIDNGSRITLRARSAKDVKKLRRQAMTFEQFWEDFECVTGPL